MSQNAKSKSSKWSPFRLMLEEARLAGVKKIRFDVDLEDYSQSSGEPHWASAANPTTPITEGGEVHMGTTGQQVLERVVVAAKKK